MHRESGVSGTGPGAGADSGVACLRRDLGAVGSVFWVFLLPLGTLSTPSCVEPTCPATLSQCTTHGQEGGHFPPLERGQTRPSKHKVKSLFLPGQNTFFSNTWSLQTYVLAPKLQSLLKAPPPSGPQRNEAWVYFPSKCRSPSRARTLQQAEAPQGQHWAPAVDCQDTESTTRDHQRGQQARAARHGAA